MDSRLLEIVMGDWSDDGDGRKETVLVRVWGEDSTDDAMRDARDRAIEATGVEFSELFAGGEGPSISSDDLDTLVENGFDPAWPKSDIGGKTPSFWRSCGASDETPYSAVSLLMFYASFGSPDIGWEIVLPPTVVGSHNSILGAGFGFGLISIF